MPHSRLTGIHRCNTRTSTSRSGPAIDSAERDRKPAGELARAFSIIRYVKLSFTLDTLDLTHIESAQEGTERKRDLHAHEAPGWRSVSAQPREEENGSV